MRKVEYESKDYDVSEYIKEVQKAFPNIRVDYSNVNVLSQIMEESKNCEDCKGLMYCKNSILGCFSKLDEATMTTSMCKCDYKKEDDLIKNQGNLIKTLYLPKSVLSSSMNEYITSDEARKKIYNYGLKFVNEYSKDNYMKGLLLSGEYATGKTYFLAALANELAKKDVTSLLIYFPDLARELKSSIGTDRFEELINLLKTVDVLMLDDIGSEMLTSWLRDEILGPILNYRLMEQLPVFFSTNLSVEQLTSHFACVKDDASDDTKSGRIISRIQGLATFVQMGETKFKR